MSKIGISKNVFNKDLEKAIDINFKYLIKTEEQPEFTLDDFFQLYGDVFYQIPKEGDANSHEYILNKTAEYLGVKLANDIDVQALLEEITTLKQQLVDSQQMINDLTKSIR
jgi:hypothetical protein